MVIANRQPDDVNEENEGAGENTTDIRALTNRQQLFIESYIGPARWNATEAARMAGYNGTSEVLKVQGSRMLKDRRIAARVSERMAEAIMTADECMAELSALARQPLIETLTIKRNGRGEVIDARYDTMGKVRALELVGKQHGLFKEKLELSREDEVVRTLVYLPPDGFEHTGE